MFNSYKANGVNKETLKKALTESLNQDEFLVSRSNIDKFSKRPTSQISITRNRPEFSKSQSLHTSALSRPGWVSTKKSPTNKKDSKNESLAVSAVKRITPKRTIKPEEELKTSSRSINSPGGKSAKKKSLIKCEYFIKNSSISGKPEHLGEETKTKPYHSSAKGKASRIDSASTKNFSASINDKNNRGVASYEQLFRQSRHNTPSVASKNKFSRTADRLSEPVVVGMKSNRKKKVDPKYRTFFNAFQKKNFCKNSKNSENKQSTVGSIKSLSNQSPDERPSYASKRSAFDPLTGSKHLLNDDPIRKDLLEMNELIGKLRIATDCRLPTKTTHRQAAAFSHSKKSLTNTPLDSVRGIPTVGGTAESNLDQVYRDLIKKTNELYREIYTE